MEYRQQLVAIAESLASQPLTSGRSVEFLYEPFAEEDGRGFDWCAAFVFHCVVAAGFPFPARWPVGARCSFAGVWGWVDWARSSDCLSKPHQDPVAGDLVVFDDLLGEGPCDHIGIIVTQEGRELVVAEGNVGGISGLFDRPIDPTIMGWIRLPEPKMIRQQLDAAR